MSLSQTKVSSAVSSRNLSPNRFTRVTSAPAAIIGRKAMIEPGERADIAVFDLEKSFTVDPADFVSMGRSTPFEGAKLWGETCLTICGGKTVYRRK